MSNLYIPCPKCGWQDTELTFSGYGKNLEDMTIEMTFKVKCFHCMFLGEVVFPCTILTEREGKKQ